MSVSKKKHLQHCNTDIYCTRGLKHCQNDHYCCQQSKVNQSLQKSIKILQDSIKKQRQDKMFLEKMNSKLMEELKQKFKSEVDNSATKKQEYTKQLRQVYEEKIEKLNHRHREIINQMEDRFYKAEELRRKQFEARIQDYKRQEGFYREQINKLSTELKQQIALVYRLQNQITEINKSKQYLNSRIRELENTNRIIENDIIARNSQIQHMKQSLKMLEQSYNKMSDKLLNQQVEKRQAQVNQRSKQDMVRVLQRQISDNEHNKVKILSENKKLQEMVNRMDIHMNEYRRRQFQAAQDLAQATDVIMRKSDALNNIKRDVERLKYK